MVTSVTKEARLVHPPEVEPCELEGVEEGAFVGVGEVVAVGGGVVAVGETACVGVGAAGVMAGAVAVTVGGWAVLVGIGELVGVGVEVGEAAMA
jgi:hypothetical protein